MGAKTNHMPLVFKIMERRFFGIKFRHKRLRDQIGQNKRTNRVNLRAMSNQKK